MIVFISYLVVFCLFIYFKGFFRLFDDAIVSRKQLTLLFFGKALAVPVFVYVHQLLYGGLEDLDAGKFYHDVRLLSDYGKEHVSFLLRLLSGMQDDRPGSADYAAILKDTMNWDNGTAKDYLYNDNRVLIRLHVLLDLISFKSLLVHGLFSCFLSFVGIFFLYQALKSWFEGKELLLLLLLCFFPSLWFYTGGLLKEGLVLFILGHLLYQLKCLAEGRRKIGALLWLLVLIYLSLLLKPYLLFFACLFFGAFFFILYSVKIKRKALVFISFLLVLVLAVNTVSLLLKKSSLLEAAATHQRRFVGVSKGGVFLSGPTKFIRLSYDTTQIKAVEKERYTIRPDVSYMYWKPGYPKDTLYCAQNMDTVSTYALAYTIKPGKSNIVLPASSPLLMAGACFYYTLFYPLFFNAHGVLQLVASLENLLIVAGLLILLPGLLKREKDLYLPLALLIFALALCLLIGFSAPNSGAIFRYRSPAMILLLSGALYFLKAPAFRIKK